MTIKAILALDKVSQTEALVVFHRTRINTTRKNPVKVDHRIVH